MKLARFVKGRVARWRESKAKGAILRQFPKAADELSRDQWEASLTDPTAFYLRCFHYFHTRLPHELQTHRQYFTQRKRGFGEDAFHTMWYLLFREFRPKSFLEIGVYRGQTISLAALLARLNQQPCEVFGISPFTPAGDSVSTYKSNIDYHDDTLANFDHFRLPRATLLRAFSTDDSAVKLISSRPWQAIYIDGNHDYDIARRDWEHCSRNVAPGGVIILDDSGLSTTFQPPLFATKGHPGPSKLAAEIDRKEFREILQVGHNRVFQKNSG